MLGTVTRFLAMLGWAVEGEPRSRPAGRTAPSAGRRFLAALGRDWQFFEVAQEAPGEVTRGRTAGVPAIRRRRRPGPSQWAVLGFLGVGSAAAAGAAAAQVSGSIVLAVGFALVAVLVVGLLR